MDFEGYRGPIFDDRFQAGFGERFHFVAQRLGVYRQDGSLVQLTAKRNVVIEDLKTCFAVSSDNVATRFVSMVLALAGYYVSKDKRVVKSRGGTGSLGAVKAMLELIEAEVNALGTICFVTTFSRYVRFSTQCCRTSYMKFFFIYSSQNGKLRVLKSR